MEYQVLTVSQAADALGVSPSSVRRLCSEYAGHLSDGANPGKGSVRKLSKRDIRSLSEVVRLKAEGKDTDSIRQQLGNTVFHEDTEPPQAAQEAHSAAFMPAVIVNSLQVIDSRLQALESQQSQLDTVDALQRVIAPLTANDEAIASRLDALESQRQKIDIVWIAVACFVAGLIVGLAVWWF